MEKLEKYSLETVIETLKKCSGVQICMVYPSLKDADSDYQRTVFEFDGLKLISNLCSYDLELVNGSRIWFFSESQAASQLLGRRAHQVFVKDVSEKFIEENCRPLISTRLSKGPLYRTGVFELYNELDFVKRLCRGIVNELQDTNTVKELKETLNKGLAVIENEYAN